MNPFRPKQSPPLRDNTFSTGRQMTQSLMNVPNAVLWFLTRTDDKLPIPFYLTLHVVLPPLNAPNSRNSLLSPIPFRRGQPGTDAFGTKKDYNINVLLSTRSFSCKTSPYRRLVIRNREMNRLTSEWLTSWFWFCWPSALFSPMLQLSTNSRSVRIHRRSRGPSFSFV